MVPVNFFHHSLRKKRGSSILFAVVINATPTDSQAEAKPYIETVFSRERKTPPRCKVTLANKDGTQPPVQADNIPPSMSNHAISLVGL
jgi:hypothetical protein